MAAVLRQMKTGLELLFILRAKHPRDPWSGQMAWPGGRVDDGDAGPLATAVRETREELALDLERDGELLGALSEVRTHLRRGPGPLSVVPFVFELKGEPALVPNSEVQEALWVPLPFLLDRREPGTVRVDGARRAAGHAQLPFRGPRDLGADTPHARRASPCCLQSLARHQGAEGPATPLSAASRPPAAALV